MMGDTMKDHILMLLDLESEMQSEYNSDASLTHQYQQTLALAKSEIIRLRKVIATYRTHIKAACGGDLIDDVCPCDRTMKESRLLNEARKYDCDGRLLEPLSA